MKINELINANEFLLGKLAYGFHWMEESLQRSMEESGFKRINRTQSMMIIYVGAGVTRPSDIAKALGISRQAVHLALCQLRDMDILLLCPDEDDKRAKRICFSDNAGPIRNTAEQILIELEELLSKRIGEDLFKALKKGMSEDWGPLARINVNH